MVCLSGVGTPAVGGLGTVTHLNEGDIMKESGRVCETPDKLRIVFPLEKHIQNFRRSSVHKLVCSDTELN